MREIIFLKQVFWLRPESYRELHLRKFHKKNRKSFLDLDIHLKIRNKIKQTAIIVMVNGN